jgi:hypothetical protein
MDGLMLSKLRQGRLLSASDEHSITVGQNFQRPLRMKQASRLMTDRTLSE